MLKNRNEKSFCRIIKIQINFEKQNKTIEKNFL